LTAIAQPKWPGQTTLRRVTIPRMPGSALITGVSRRVGIAYTIAQRLHRDGWCASLSGWPAHDAEQPWGGDDSPPDLDGMTWQAADLGDPTTPERVVADHVGRFGGLDALVAVHARSSRQDLDQVTAAEIDASFAVNARATVLLVQAAARAGVRRVVLFTTGVHQGPMPDEIPYVLSKAAIQGVTATLAAALAGSGATVNCINPGPVDTGYADADARAFVASRMPLAARWGTPGDIAGTVAWLVSDGAGWMTGQTIDVDGGWGIRSGVPPRG
jgi:3-oxoacyl-[acyl-carrier protein] reductase